MSVPPGRLPLRHARRDDLPSVNTLQPILRYVFALIYGVAMFFSYRELSATWTYAGFAYAPIGLMLVPLLSISALPAVLLPNRPRSLAEFSAWVLLFSLFLPALIIPQLQGWMSGWRSFELYMILFASTCLFFVMTRRPARPFGIPRFDSTIFWLLVLGLWTLLHAAIVILFGGVMSIAGFEQVYEQRSMTSAGWSGGIIVYVLSNAASALNPFLIATGFAERKYWRIPLGIAGLLIVYSVLAGKIVLVFPILVLATFLLFDRQGRLISNRLALTLVVIGLMGVPIIASYEVGSGTLSYIIDLVYFRTLYLPGVLVGAYNDFFTTFPVTYFSHSLAGRLFVEYPYGIWSVGQVVGAYVTPAATYDEINNYNANFIAADGITGLGRIGIPLVVALVAIILRLIDRVLGSIELRVRCAAFVPFIMWLSDGSLFTAILTGGGLSLIILMWLWGGTQHPEELAKRAASKRLRSAARA